MQYPGLIAVERIFTMATRDDITRSLQETIERIELVRGRL
jgi:hypothetical protein